MFSEFTGVHWSPFHAGKNHTFSKRSNGPFCSGSVRYFERDELPVVIQDTPSVRSQTWRVVRYEGPDITNMPSYLVQHDNTFMTARHESLDLVKE